MLINGYGLPGLSFIETLHFLEELNISYTSISEAVHIFEGIDLPYKIVVCKSLASFYNKREKLEKSKFDVVVIVIDCIETVKKTNLTLLGYEDNQFVTFVKSDLKKVLKTVNVSDTFVFDRKPSNVINKLIEKYNADSVVQEIQTSFYRIKNTETRKTVVDLIKKFILSKISYKVAYDACNKICSDKELLAVFQNLKTEKTKKLIKALKETGSLENKRLEKIAKSYNLSPFDLRYFLSKK